MLNQITIKILDLFKESKFEYIDAYLIDVNKKEPFNKDILIALSIWLDFKEYTWNEYSIERLTIFLNQFPQDEEISILYMYFSYKLNNIEDISIRLKVLDTIEYSIYRDIYIKYKLLLILYHEKNKSIAWIFKDLRTYLSDQPITRSNSLDYLLIQYFHKWWDWKNAIRNLEELFENSQILKVGYTYPIFHLPDWIEVEIRGNYKDFIEKDWYKKIKNLLNNKWNYTIDLYESIR